VYELISCYLGTDPSRGGSLLPSPGGGDVRFCQPAPEWAECRDYLYCASPAGPQEASLHLGFKAIFPESR
jgi:hypothetical protein